MTHTYSTNAITTWESSRSLRMGEVNLDEYLVPGTSSTYYIPDFVTDDEEEYLIRKVRTCRQLEDVYR